MADIEPMEGIQWEPALIGFDDKGTLMLHVGGCSREFRAAIGSQLYVTQNACQFIIDPQPPGPPVMKCQDALSAAKRVLRGRPDTVPDRPGAPGPRPRPAPGKETST